MKTAAAAPSGAAAVSIGRVRAGAQHAAPGYSAYVLIVSVVVPGGYAERYGSGPWTIVTGYWGIATVAAAILGLVRPLLRYGFGTFLIGSVIGTFVYGSFAWVLGQQIAGYWWVWLIPGTLVGGGLAMVWRTDPMLR